ncbi:MAG TPA: hypothetical protein VFX25_14250 [Streptosporangiaceae bacterium]|nr:hypothetical protein [Streptosporangiaceae bacterium]
MMLGEHDPELAVDAVHPPRPSRAHSHTCSPYVRLSGSARPELRGEGQLAWLNRLETEAANLSAASSWLIDRDRLNQAITFIWTT